MKHKFLVRLVIAAVMATAGALDYASAIIVRTPTPRHRATVMGRPPRRGMVWNPGFYSWRGGQFTWMPGRWVVPPRPGAVWVAPRWRRTRGGYTFVAGRWYHPRTRRRSIERRVGVLERPVESRWEPSWTAVAVRRHDRCRNVIGAVIS